MARSLLNTEHVSLIIITIIIPSFLLSPDGPGASPDLFLFSNIFFPASIPARSHHRNVLLHSFHCGKLPNSNFNTVLLLLFHFFPPSSEFVIFYFHSHSTHLLIHSFQCPFQSHLPPHFSLKSKIKYIPSLQVLFFRYWD